MTKYGLGLKTRGYVLPNILQCSESFIVADTKNSLRAETEAVLRQNGYKVLSLGFNRQLRKVTKAKSVFPTDDSLFKMLYLAMVDITKKWTGRRQDWSMIHAQLAVYFADRMPD